MKLVMIIYALLLLAPLHAAESQSLTPKEHEAFTRWLEINDRLLLGKLIHIVETQPAFTPQRPAVTDIINAIKKLSENPKITR